MFRTLLAAFLLLAGPVPALAKNYLTDQAAFDAAWAELAEEAGLYGKLKGMASHITVRPDVIELVAQTSPNSFKLNIWRVRHEKHLIWGERDEVTNHGEPLKSGRYIDTRRSVFDVSGVPLDRLIAVARDAAGHVVFKWQPKTLGVTIGRRYVGTREKPFREVRWEIEAGVPGDLATLVTDAGGAYVEADISRTVKGRDRNFLEQTDWPFAEAQKGLAERITDGQLLRLTARPNAISVSVTSPKSRNMTPTHSWDGGRYKTNAMNMMGQRWHLLGGRGTFSLSDFKLTDLHGMIAAARRIAGQPSARPDRPSPRSEGQLQPAGDPRGRRRRVSSRHRDRAW